MWLWMGILDSCFNFPVHTWKIAVFIHIRMAFTISEEIAGNFSEMNHYFCKACWIVEFSIFEKVRTNFTIVLNIC